MPSLDDALPNAQVRQALERLHYWHLDGGYLVCDFHFPSFSTAMRFVNSIAGMAEEARHYPEIEVRLDHVRLALRSAGATGLTQRDLRFARAVNALCGRPAGR